MLALVLLVLVSMFVWVLVLVSGLGVLACVSPRQPRARDRTYLNPLLALVALCAADVREVSLRLVGGEGEHLSPPPLPTPSPRMSCSRCPPHTLPCR